MCDSQNYQVYLLICITVKVRLYIQHLNPKYFENKFFCFLFDSWKTENLELLGPCWFHVLRLGIDAKYQESKSLSVLCTHLSVYLYLKKINVE